MGRPPRLRHRRPDPPAHRLDRPEGGVGHRRRVEEGRHLRRAADPGLDSAPAWSRCGSASSASSCSPSGSCSRRPSHHSEASDRLKAAAKGVTYLFFAWSTFKVGQGASSSAEKQTEDFTAGLMGSPGGRLLVAVVGLVVLGIAGYHVYKGWTKKFLEDLREHPGHWAVTAGRIGYIAKGVALVIVGLLLPRRRLAGRPRQGAGPRRCAQDPQGRAVRPVPADPGGRGHRRLRRLLLRPVPLRAGLSGLAGRLAPGLGAGRRCRMPARGAGSSTPAARRAAPLSIPTTMSDTWWAPR